MSDIYAENHHRDPIKTGRDLEILSKLYLELANVVPVDCVSSREKAMQKHIDAYGTALMLIAEGCANPRVVASDAIVKWGN
jgi:hypothetical protein